MKDPRTVIVEELTIKLYLFGIKILELDCDNELEVRRLMKAWMYEPK